MAQVASHTLDHQSLGRWFDPRPMCWTPVSLAYMMRTTSSFFYCAISNKAGGPNIIVLLLCDQ